MTGYKNYGPGVSQNPQDTTTGGSFSADGRSYDSVVIQNDKPVIDWEMNLRGDVGSLARQTTSKNQHPTCWLNGDFLESPNPTFGGSYSFLPAIVGNENKFRISASNLIVNGWNVRFEFSGISTPNLNEITLPAPPVSGTRTDLVILEVWRAVLAPAPSTQNKSATGLILRNGNVKAPDAVNLADDLIDPVFAAESTLRVQIQYRFRVITGVDLAGFPNGIDSPAVFAHTVSDFSGPGADGSITGFNYIADPNDSGLWLAGNGNAASATSLGTVDGLMYATPICAIYRRNTTSFDKDVNLNGGSSIASGVSTRPDGFFADQITAFDIIDLRRAGITNYSEILEKAVQQVFDNTLSTNQESLSGVVGTTLFVRNDIGGASLGSPDHVRRHYSDRSVSELIVAQINVGGLPQSSGQITLSSFLLPWNFAPVNILSTAPTGTNISGVTQIRIVGGGQDLDMIGAGLVQSVIYSTDVSGIDKITVNFTGPLTNRTIYVELMVEYPFNHGLTRNLVQHIATWAPPPAFIASWADSTKFTATPDVNRFLLGSSYSYGDSAHREIAVLIPTISQARVFITSGLNQLIIWEKLDGSSITINDGTNPPYTTTNYTINTAFTLVTLSGASNIPAGTNVTVNYKALRPAPQLGAFPLDSYQVYFRSAAIQSVQPPSGTQTLNLIPRLTDQNAYVITASTGSPNDMFPYFAPGEQIAIGSLPTPDYPEAVLNNPALIETATFNIDTGFGKMSLVIPYSPNPAQVRLFRDALDTVQDAEGRNFWPRSQNPSDPVQVYSPVLFSFPLVNPENHKVVVPCLMELKEDFASIGRKGTLILVLFTGWQEYSTDNKIELRSSASDFAASVYRITGNPINMRRSS